MVSELLLCGSYVNINMFLNIFFWYFDDGGRNVFITLYVDGISTIKHHSKTIKYRSKYEQTIRSYPIIQLSLLPQGCKLNVDK